MPYTTPNIHIPSTDMWTTLFSRSSKPYPDSQVLFTHAVTNRNYTFAQLLSLTPLFGTGLRKSFPSFRKGSVLALFAQNCLDTPLVTWGTHYVGGVISPANPSYTMKELVFHLKDSGAEVIVTEKRFLNVVRQAAEEAGLDSSRILVMGEDKEGLGKVKTIEDVIVREDERMKQEKLDVEKDLAFLVYSSGTTGLPKGVMLTHRNSVSNLFMVSDREGEAMNWQEDRILSVLPFYHIYGLQFLMHVPFYIGVPSVIMPAFDLPMFCSLIQNHRISKTYVAPPVVLHLAKNKIVDNYDLSSLKTMVSGAAPLTQDLIFAVRRRLGTDVKQAYGLSETSPATHIQRRGDIALGSVGPPLANQIVKFMSPEGREVPTGTEGEVWIAGPNVFLGYHNNPTATASSLTEPTSTEPVFFKTGDIGYADANGNMYITDRVKELIKYKGFQVAPAELEGILVGHEDIDDVAVVGGFDKERETEVPVAFVVLKEGRKEEGKAIEIQQWLEGKVASHKRLRGGVKFVKDIPKSASGKILRRLLKDKLKAEEVIKAKL